MAGAILQVLGPGEHSNHQRSKEGLLALIWRLPQHIRVGVSPTFSGFSFPVQFEFSAFELGEFFFSFLPQLFFLGPG